MLLSIKTGQRRWCFMISDALPARSLRGRPASLGTFPERAELRLRKGLIWRALSCEFRGPIVSSPCSQGGAPWLLTASVRLAHEDKCRAGHDRGAGADEGDVGVLDLARAGAARCLQSAFDDVPEAVDASGAEAAAKGVERQLAVELDMPVLDEIEGLALLAETVGLEPVDHRGGEAVVDLGHVDILRTEAGALPGQLRRAAAALHVAAEAADAARHLEVEPLAVAGEIGRPRLQIARPV